VIQSFYSSELNATTSQSYSRDCQNIGYYYETIDLNVVENGSYTLGSVSNIDTYGYIYNGNFNPFNPSENLLSHIDDGCGYEQFRLVTHLQVNIPYILLVTTYLPDITGPFWIFVSGPNNVSLNRSSKYM